LCFEKFEVLFGYWIVCVLVRFLNFVSSIPMEEKSNEVKNLLPGSIFISSIILASAWIYKAESKTRIEPEKNRPEHTEKSTSSVLEEAVLPSGGVILPVTWGNLGSRLASVGAIDAEKLEALYVERGEFTEEYRALLLEQSRGRLKMTEENSGYLLNLFWALGLASKNPILDSGEMKDSRYGGAENFASTAGWTIAKGNPMEHFSRHKFFNLTPSQQELVEKVSRGIYRPCCGNSTHFPDCNHGMAMLGLLELMASQGVGEEEMWKAALAVNSYWFPDTYLTIAAYMKNKGVEWQNVEPREMLGAKYSSAQGYAKVASQVVAPRGQSGGSGCGVESGGAAPAQKQSGCGI